MWWDVGSASFLLDVETLFNFIVLKFPFQYPSPEWDSVTKEAKVSKACLYWLLIIFTIWYYFYRNNEKTGSRHPSNFQLLFRIKFVCIFQLIDEVFIGSVFWKSRPNQKNLEWFRATGTYRLTITFVSYFLWSAQWWKLNGTFCFVLLSFHPFFPLGIDRSYVNSWSQEEGNSIWCFETQMDICKSKPLLESYKSTSFLTILGCPVNCWIYFLLVEIWSIFARTFSQLISECSYWKGHLIVVCGVGNISESESLKKEVKPNLIIAFSKKIVRNQFPWLIQ